MLSLSWPISSSNWNGLNLVKRWLQRGPIQWWKSLSSETRRWLSSCVETSGRIVCRLLCLSDQSVGWVMCDGLGCLHFWSQATPAHLHILISIYRGWLNAINYRDELLQPVRCAHVSRTSSPACLSARWCSSSYGTCEHAVPSCKQNLCHGLLSPQIWHLLNMSRMGWDGLFLGDNISRISVTVRRPLCRNGTNCHKPSSRTWLTCVDAQLVLHPMEDTHATDIHLTMFILTFLVLTPMLFNLE